MQLKLKGIEGEDINHEPKHMTTIQSEGPRTELKSLCEIEEGKEFMPGLKE